MSVLLVLALLTQPAPVAPRPAAAGTVVEARLEAKDTFVVDLYADLDALLLGLSPAASLPQRLAAMETLRAEGANAQAAAVDRLIGYLRRRLRVRFDGVASELEVQFPERRTAGADLATLGSFARLRARVPAEAREVTFFASRSFKFIDLRAAIGETRTRQMVEPGAESAPIALR